MTLIVPKKEGETIGEIRERASRIVKRKTPQWWAELFPAEAKVKGDTPLARRPAPEGDDDADS